MPASFVNCDSVQVGHLDTGELMFLLYIQIGFKMANEIYEVQIPCHGVKQHCFGPRDLYAIIYFEYNQGALGEAGI